MNISFTSPVGQIVAEKPALSILFERYGIDYCCGGRQTLGDACQRLSIDPQTVIDEIASFKGKDETESKWLNSSLTELVEHIVTTHHAYLNETLPRISNLAAKVAKAHGVNHPNMVKLVDVYAEFRTDMEQHTFKEEKVLFPICRQLDSDDARPEENHCGTVANPIRVMESEHDHAANLLVQMRELTDGFTVPGDACNTYRALIDALKELEADTHRHIHKENSILFPRAILRESAILAK
jgi:regulator of cell morphogenesis and NO signaling